MHDAQTEVKRLADSTLSEAETLQAVTEGETPEGLGDDYGLDSTADYIDLLNAMALEVYGNREVGPYRDGLVSVTVITGTGGPHTEFTVSSDGTVTALAVWGSDRAESRGYLPGLFDTLAELVGGSE